MKMLVPDVRDEYICVVTGLQNDSHPALYEAVDPVSLRLTEQSVTLTRTLHRNLLVVSPFAIVSSSQELFPLHPV